MVFWITLYSADVGSVRFRRCIQKSSSTRMRLPTRALALATGLSFVLALASARPPTKSSMHAPPPQQYGERPKQQETTQEEQDLGLGVEYNR
jgi:hypothetical protein